jgi:hypothetical protein
MTSLEFLFNELWKSTKDKLTWHSIFEQAKEMHKQEIIDAYNKSFELRDKPYSTADKYYQETFVSKGSDDTLKDYHIVDTNEMVKLPQQDVDKLGNEDVPKLGYDVENFATEWIDKNSHKWSNNTDEVGDNYGSFVAGWNKCKENTYTEEQVREAIFEALALVYHQSTIGVRIEYVNEIIQSLKQPKQ